MKWKTEKIGVLYTYELIKEQDASDGRTVFGIVAKDSENKILLKISDVFANEEKVRELVALCNRHNASVVHIRDIIDDMIIDS